jgi:hypothetical protein
MPDDAKTGDAKNPFAFDPVRAREPHEGPPMKEEHFIRGTTPMHKAAALLKLDAVDKLLAEGTEDLDKGDALNQTPLILLARNHYAKDDVPQAVAMIQKLVAAGATLVDSEGKIKRDDYGDSAIVLAAMAVAKNGHSILKALVESLPEDSRGKLVSSRCKNFGNTGEYTRPLHSPGTGAVRPCPLCRARHGAQQCGSAAIISYLLPPVSALSLPLQHSTGRPSVATFPPVSCLSKAVRQCTARTGPRRPC